MPVLLSGDRVASPRAPRDERRPDWLSLAVIALAVVLSVVLLPSASRADAPALDWDALPTAPVQAPDDFDVVDCEGDGPFLCVLENGELVGQVEHLSNPLSTFPDVTADLAAGASERAALIAEIDRFMTTFREDREAGCPPGYEFRPQPTVGATVAGLDGIRYGFTVLDDGGRLVESVLGYMVIRATDSGPVLSVLAANELNEGACLGSEGYLVFTDGGLGRFAPILHGIAARSDLGQGSLARPQLSEEVHLSGSDAVASAIALADAALQGRLSPVVLIARDDDFADALASGVAQGVLDAPLLLTDGSELDPRVAEAVQRVGAERAVILGGDAAITPQVAVELAGLGLEVERIGGADRIATSLAIADVFAPVAERVVLARAYGDAADPTRAFADALGAGALAADEGVPLVLTASEVLDERIATWLAGRGVEEVVIMGGLDAIAQPVRQRLVEEGVGIEVLDGAERAETAVLANVQREMRGAQHPAGVVLVDGRNWADGLAATLLTHLTGSGLVLADGDVLPLATASFLSAADPTDVPALVCTPSVTITACDTAGAAMRAQ